MAIIKPADAEFDMFNDWTIAETDHGYLAYSQSVPAFKAYGATAEDAETKLAALIAEWVLWLSDTPEIPFWHDEVVFKH